MSLQWIHLLLMSTSCSYHKIWDSNLHFTSLWIKSLFVQYPHLILMVELPRIYHGARNWSWDLWHSEKYKYLCWGEAMLMWGLMLQFLKLSTLGGVIVLSQSSPHHQRHMPHGQFQASFEVSPSSWRKLSVTPTEAHNTSNYVWILKLELKILWRAWRWLQMFQFMEWDERNEELVILNPNFIEVRALFTILKFAK